MAISVQQINNESIILCEFEGNVDKQSVVDIYSRSLELATTIPGPIYRIFDLSQVTSDHEDVLTMIADVARDVAGAGVYPELAAVFVGAVPAASGPTKDIARWFANPDDALTYVRQQTGERIPG